MALFCDLKAKSGLKVDLRNFDDTEAQKFIEAYEMGKSDEKAGFLTLKKETNFNPLLLHVAIWTQKEMQLQKRRWKDKYDDVVKAHLRSTVMKEIEKLTTATFSYPREISQIDAFTRWLQNTDYFLYFARTGLPLPMNEIEDFLKAGLIRMDIAT